MSRSPSIMRLASVLPIITHYVRAFSEPPNPPGCEPPGKPRQLCPWLWSSTPRLLWLLHLLKAATNHGLTPQPHCWSKLSKTFPLQPFSSQMKDPGCTVPWLPDKSAICTGENEKLQRSVKWRTSFLNSTLGRRLSFHMCNSDRKIVSLVSYSHSRLFSCLSSTRYLHIF